MPHWLWYVVSACHAVAVLNEPSRLLVLIPASLPAGNYELSITTQFSNTSKVFLKSPRTEVFNVPVIIA
ncbi:DUF4469 domain-containing protein [Bergeyella cardium]|nr:DUF4469 domain-containing protein [Bergeyella cardium]WHE33432.1 DUF4469 domain-containing protein [Bergeyella cardium]WHF60082.1 DUF4469 domain-containing protein [Bergeyella cardium]